MIIITSISPKDVERQKTAIESWKRFELKIISVNHISEIEILKPEFPFVDFIEPKRTAFDVYKKHYIFINDLIKIGHQIDECIFILNSDIFLSESDFTVNNFCLNRNILNILNWFEYLSANSLICLRKYDKTGDKLECWIDGYDGFIINKKFESLFKNSHFVLGQCFWDWYIPMTFFVNGNKTWIYDKPFLIHETHERNHDQSQWNKNLLKFKNIFLEILNKDKIFVPLANTAITTNNRSCNNYDIIL